MPELEGKFKVTISPEKYPPFKAGVYRARLLDVSAGKGNYKPAYFLIWEIVEVCEFKGRKVRDIINQSAHGLNGKLWQLYRAVTETELDVFDTFYIDAFAGKECFIDVEERGKYNVISEYINPENLAGIERINIAG